jgi:stringent starvation protein B
MDNKAAEKKERLLQALDQGMVMVHLDARRPGVLVPVSLRTEAHLRLNLSYRFDPPDLSVGDWGVRCTLSFSGSRFTVAVPWSALFAITSHTTKEFWMYPDDMPEELIQMTVPPPAEGRAPREGEGGGQEGAEPGAPGAPRALLREVVYQPEAAPAPHATGEEGQPTEPQDDPPRPRGRSHLRLVK